MLSKKRFEVPNRPKPGFDAEQGFRECRGRRFLDPAHTLSTPFLRLFGVLGRARGGGRPAPGPRNAMGLQLHSPFGLLSLQPSLLDSYVLSAK
jgi:hypothetical protein